MKEFKYNAKVAAMHTRKIFGMLVVLNAIICRIESQFQQIIVGNANCCQKKAKK